MSETEKTKNEPAKPAIIAAAPIVAKGIPEAARVVKRKRATMPAAKSAAKPAATKPAPKPAGDPVPVKIIPPAAPAPAQPDKPSESVIESALRLFGW